MRDDGMSLSSIFFDDAVQIGFFELFFDGVRNENFSCSFKPPKKLCTQHDCLRSMWSSYSSGYHLIRAMATDSAMLRLTAPLGPVKQTMQYCLDFSFCIFKKHQCRNYRLFLTCLRSKKQRQFCYFSFSNRNSEPTTTKVPVCSFVPSNWFFLASMVFRVLR